MTEDMTIIAEEAYSAAREILEKAKLEPGELFVVGCSTSEVEELRSVLIPAPELAEMVFGGIYQATQGTGCTGRSMLRTFEPRTDPGKRGSCKIRLSYGQCGPPAQGMVGLLQRQHTKPSSIRWLWSIFRRQQEWILGIR